MLEVVGTGGASAARELSLVPAAQCALPRRYSGSCGSPTSTQPLFAHLPEGQVVLVGVERHVFVGQTGVQVIHGIPAAQRGREACQVGQRAVPAGLHTLAAGSGGHAVQGGGGAVLRPLPAWAVVRGGQEGEWIGRSRVTRCR